MHASATVTAEAYVFAFEAESNAQTVKDEVAPSLYTTRKQLRDTYIEKRYESVTELKEGTIYALIIIIPGRREISEYRLTTT